MLLLSFFFLTRTSECENALTERRVLNGIVTVLAGNLIKTQERLEGFVNSSRRCKETTKNDQTKSCPGF